MNDDFLMQEAKMNLSLQKEFQTQMGVMRENMAQQLTSGIGNEIRRDIEKTNKPTLRIRIKNFFAKLLNTL